jgi:hypothetical protein
MIGRWLRMLWPKNRKTPSQDAQLANDSAAQSLAAAHRVRDQSKRLRVAAEEAEEAVRSHNTSNHYASWLEDQIRGRS